jgi:tRNA nucleotidyltransferase (CCA-adding enzyme)
LADFSDEACVLLLAKQQRLQSVVRLSLLKRQLVAYMKNRAMKTVLTGWDLQAMGLQPGPQFKKILGRLLDARLNGKVKTEFEERELLQQLIQKLNTALKRTAATSKGGQDGAY